MVEPAIGWGVSVLGWVVSPIIFKLLTQGFDSLGYDTTTKLAQLEPKILMLKRVMELVEENPDRPHLEKLFKELKTAFYEAEEILDAVEYRSLEKQIQEGKLQSEGGTPPRKRDRMKKKLRSARDKFHLLTNMESGMSKRKLIKSLKKIEEVINEAHKILENLNLPSISDGNRRHAMDANRPTTAFSPHKVLGRDNDRNKIIEMLHEKDCGVQPSTSNNLCFSVIGIHGVGGSGKSTLAQLVYAHEEKDKQDNKEGHFDLVMWVHVSQSFRLLDIFKELYEAASEPKVACPQFNNLAALGKELERKLDGKRFLLILDDVWCNKDVSGQNLPELLSPLKVGKRGSKILVTTRSKNALTDLGPGVRYNAMPVPEFDNAAFFELFMHYALEDGQDQSKFQNIGADIANKLMRSPLAAKTVGGNLRRQQEVSYWRGVSEQNLFKVRTGPLWWSYYQLGEQARCCFAYCSIFPRRHRLLRDDLVRLWVAEGFIRNNDEEGDMEDVGQEIFNELLSISFLQPGGQDWYNHGKEYYFVHDLLHDLAEAVAGNDCFRIDNNTSQKGKVWTGDIPRDVHHLFVQSYDATLITKKIIELRNLRTLIIYTVGEDTPVEKTVIKSILKSLTKLRVLAIALCLKTDAFIRKPNILSIPESVGQVKHIRYLSFRTNEECEVILPSSLNQLYQMQLLDFGHCKNLVFSYGDLMNLRHVFSGPGSRISNISGLDSLQTLPQFTVRNEQGHEAKQLRYLNRLSGRLYISGLEMVKSREEALEFDLAAKKRLTCLSLSFCGSSEVAAEVLEGLCPPVRLEKLEILFYKGLVYPNWMVGRQNGGPENLQELTLFGWRQPGPAPELEAFIHLRKLSLTGCYWNALPGNMKHLSALKTVWIYNCVNLRSLPTLPRSLEHFKLVGCNDRFMRSCETDGHPNSQKIKHIPNKKFGR